MPTAFHDLSKPLGGMLNSCDRPRISGNRGSADTVGTAMRALVTGASGFVGRHLVDHLRADGDDVIGLDLGRGPDLRDHDAWRKVVAEAEPDVIYHLAGWSDVGGSWKDPWETYEINVLGTVSILEAARRPGAGTSIRVVLVSSADVYGTADPDRLPLTEHAPVQPRSPYGASKQGAEAAALAYGRGFSVPVVIARPFNHMGPGQSPRFAAPSWAHQIAAIECGVHLIPADRPVSDAEGDAHVVSHGDLTPCRDITDVRDVVRAYRLLAERGEPGQTYNICSGRAVAMQEVFDTLTGLSSAPITGVVDPKLRRPVDLPVLCGDNGKLRAATGWTPRMELAQTLAAVLDDARRRVQAAGGSAENANG